MTVAEVLLKSGWTQAQIDALDAKAMSGLNEFVGGIEKTAAEKEAAAKAAAEKAEADRKAAEASAVLAKEAEEKAALSKRSVDEFWRDTYNPGMAAAEAEKARLAKIAADAQAEAAFYKTQRESYLKTLNIDPANAPEFKPATEPEKKETPTPGSPVLVSQDDFLKRVDKGVFTIQDIGWKYQQLYGAPIPVSPSELVAQADALKLSPMEYASRTFKFAEKEAERRAADAKAHDDKIAADAVAARDAAHKAEVEKLQSEFNAEKRKIAEQSGNNPDTRTPPGSSKFSELQRATKAGERKDPTRMTAQERRQVTLENIHKAVEEREQAVA
jgi:hypothetical protein